MRFETIIATVGFALGFGIAILSLLVFEVMPKPIDRGDKLPERCKEGQRFLVTSPAYSAKYFECETHWVPK